MGPRLTVSVQSELRSTTGAAERNRESMNVIAATAASPPTAMAMLRPRVGGFFRGMSTTLVRGSGIRVGSAIGSLLSEVRAKPFQRENPLRLTVPGNVRPISGQWGHPLGTPLWDTLAWVSPEGVPGGCPQLFGPQRDRRVQPRGAPRRQV